MGFLRINSLSSEKLREVKFSDTVAVDWENLSAKALSTCTSQNVLGEKKSFQKIRVGSFGMRLRKISVKEKDHRAESSRRMQIGEKDFDKETSDVL